MSRRNYVDEILAKKQRSGDEWRNGSYKLFELESSFEIQGKLPNWILDAFDISVLNPYNGFLNAGIGATIINNPNFKWAINYSVGLNNNAHIEWSGGFKFHHSIGTGIIVTF